jgi:hypothetical protein
MIPTLCLWLQSVSCVAKSILNCPKGYSNSALDLLVTTLDQIICSNSFDLADVGPWYATSAMFRNITIKKFLQWNGGTVA